MIKFLTILLIAVLYTAISWYFFSDKGPDLFRMKKYREYPLLNRSCQLMLAMMLCTVLMSALLVLLFYPPKQTTSGSMLFALNARNIMHAGADSWQIMFDAMDELRSRPQGVLYDAVFFGRKIKFQYPLSSLLLIDYAQRAFSVPWRSIEIALNLVSWSGLIAMGFICYNLLAASVSRHEAPTWQIDKTGGTGSNIPFLIVSLVSVYLFYPLTKSFQLGQIQTLISCLSAAALLAWSRERKDMAGFFVGLCCTIKPQWGIVLIWAMFRKEWRFSFALMVTAGLFQAFSVMAYGLNNNIAYIDVLRFISRRGEAYFANQSVNGLMHRLLFNGNNLEWQANSFAPYDPVVYAVTVATSSFFLLVSLFWRAGHRPQLLDLAFIFLSGTIMSPVTWEHHYGILLPILCIALPAAIARRPFGAWTELYLLGAYFLIAQNLNPVTARFAHSYLNVVQSYLFFGALAVWGLLYRLLSASDILVSPELIDPGTSSYNDHSVREGRLFP